MRILYLLVGTVLALLLLIKALQGNKYLYLVEPLDGGEYPLKGLYGIGFAWSNGKLFALKGKMRETLIGQAKLLEDPRYAEYYAGIVWAQLLTFLHLGLAGGFLLAGIADSALMILIGVAVGGVFGFFFFNRMKDQLQTRETACTAELPDIVSTMALLINAGMMLREAWRSIADSKEGPVYDLMRQACSDMDNGMSEVDAIHKFARMTNSAEIRKFAGALSQSLERGGGDLSDFLSRQAFEMLALKKQLMLQKGEAAATKLLIPTVLLFGGIIVAVFAGAIGMLI